MTKVQILFLLKPFSDILSHSIEIFPKQTCSMNPVFFSHSISVLERVFSHKYTCVSTWGLCLLLDMLDTSVPHGLLRIPTIFHPLAEWSAWNQSILLSSIVPVSHFGLGAWHWHATLWGTMFFMQMGWPWQCSVLSPPQPTVDWQLCPGKLACYLARGTLPSIDNPAPRQQNDHKWISAVNAQGLIPSHLGWLEAWSLYSLYC